MIVIRLQQVAPHLYQSGVPRWDDAGRIARDIVVTGYYPVVAWTAPLLLGMWLGRRDLRSADAARRLLVGGALVALGQLALTAYVLHLLVLDLEPGWLLRDTVGAAWVSVARFTLVAVLLATAWRALAFRGPFEVLLRPPWTARPADASGDQRRGVGW